MRGVQKKDLVDVNGTRRAAGEPMSTPYVEKEPLSLRGVPGKWLLRMTAEIGRDSTGPEAYARFGRALP